MGQHALIVSTDVWMHQLLPMKLHEIGDLGRNERKHNTQADILTDSKEFDYSDVCDLVTGNFVVNGVNKGQLTRDPVPVRVHKRSLFI